MPLIIIVICVGAYFLYLGPTYSDIQSLSAKRDSYSQVLQTAQNTTAVRDRVLATYNSISQDDINRLQKIVPETFQSVVFANHLSSVAARDGFILDKLSMTDTTQADQGQQVVSAAQNQYKTISVSFSTGGQYQSFIKFLKDLESDLYLSDVTSLKISAGSAGKNSSSFNFDVALNTYSLN